MKVKLINTLKVPHPKNPNKDIVLRGGQVHEIDDEIAQRAIDLGSAEAYDGDAEPGQVPPEDQVGPADLPPRPSNGATKEEWRAYLVALEAATRDVLGDLSVPDDAKRDDMIALGDARVADYNAEFED